jgi:lipoic acid synthetase
MSTMETPTLEIIDWQQLDYGEALSRQQALVRQRQAEDSPDRLILVEHPPVITIGKSGVAEDLHLSREMLLSRGVAVYPIDRGGQATFHGPGQMVAYPIVKLRRKDLHWYVRNVLGAVANVLEEYGIEPKYKEGQPGLWVNGKKIAFLGISVKKWVTYHGVSLNVNNDLTAFDWFVPCGQPDEPITSMKEELGREVNIEEAKQRFIQKFRERFGYPTDQRGTHPNWLRLSAPKIGNIEKMDGLLDRLRLNTVCQSAHCPNVGECFGHGTATFMILGEKCTRSCRFCAVDKGCPAPLDDQEPRRVARAVAELGIDYAVVTSVTRDDLPDGGAGHFADTIGEIRRSCPGTEVEVLVPDFNGSLRAVATVCAALPGVFNHNIETVPRLYSRVRPEADYQRSLKILSAAAAAGLPVKSGLMLGLGEAPEEISETLADLKAAGCAYLTLGQYLSPSAKHYPVRQYLRPEAFKRWAQTAESMGFKGVAAGPLVRSSFRAKEMFHRRQTEACCSQSLRAGNLRNKNITVHSM